MGLMTRLSTLAKADAHGVVDALEDPSLMLRQHLREAGAEVTRKRCRLEALEAEIRDLQSEDQLLEERMKQLDEDVQLALAEDKEDLARFAIKKLLPLRRRRGQIAHRQAELDRRHGELSASLAGQQAEYENLEQRVKGFLAHRSQDGGAPFLADDWVVRDEDVDLELLRRKQTAAGGA